MRQLPVRREPSSNNKTGHETSAAGKVVCVLNGTAAWRTPTPPRGLQSDGLEAAKGHCVGNNNNYRRVNRTPDAKADVSSEQPFSRLLIIAVVRVVVGSPPLAAVGHARLVA